MVPPRTISKRFHLEPLKVPAERWFEEPLKVLLRALFSESVTKNECINPQAVAGR